MTKLNTCPICGHYPTSHLEEGCIVKDTQELEIGERRLTVFVKCGCNGKVKPNLACFGGLERCSCRVIYFLSHQAKG
jgi:hypothetical protein